MYNIINNYIIYTIYTIEIINERKNGFIKHRALTLSKKIFEDSSNNGNARVSTSTIPLPAVEEI